MNKSLILLALACLGGLRVPAQESAGREKGFRMPEIHGTIRAKYENEPQIDKGRFEVRNARVSLEGKMGPLVGYKAEIDLSDEGNIRMLDAYVRVWPDDRLGFTCGQMRVPFSIDAHRSPHLQFFANRSFIAKQVGDVRDVGAAVAWSFGRAVPVWLEGGVFNGSGLTRQKNFWTNDYSFSFKAQAELGRQFRIVLSCQKAKAGDTRTLMWDAGVYWQNARWHIEAEYLRKYYARGAFAPVDAVNAFAVFRLPLRGQRALSFLGRYDCMSDHSKGERDETGQLRADDPGRHRLTGGLTLGLGPKLLQADIRLNYEQYFYRREAMPPVSERNKIVLEFVAHF